MHRNIIEFKNSQRGEWQERNTLTLFLNFATYQLAAVLTFLGFALVQQI